MLQVVEIGISLKADLPVAEQDMVVGLAVIVFPLAAVRTLGALPLVMLGPAAGILQVVLLARQSVGLHVAGMVGGVVPERADLRLVGGLPVCVDLVDGLAYILSLLRRRGGRRAQGRHGQQRHGCVFKFHDVLVIRVNIQFLLSQTEGIFIF